MKTTVVICKEEGSVERLKFEDALKRITKDADERITMISPYFTYRGVLDILKQVPEHIAVDIVVSQTPQDQTYIDHRLLEKCRSLGCKIFGVENLHAKIYMVDEKRAIVGSANLTYPSVNYRWECGVIVKSPSFMEQVVKHVQLIMRQSNELTSMDIRKLQKIRNGIQRIQNKLEKQSNKAEQEWKRYVTEKPPESALILTVDGVQLDTISRKRRKKFAVVKKAFFPASWQIENLQRIKGRLSNSVPMLFYVRKWTDENSEGGHLAAIGKIPPYGYYKGSLRSLKVFRTRHFGGIPIFPIERGQEDIDGLPRKKRQQRALFVIEDYQELPVQVDNYEVEKVLSSLKDEYEWIGEGLVMGPAGRYIPIKGFQILIKKAGIE